MRILGIDPGLAHTGWAVVDVRDNAYKAIAYGCTCTKASETLVKRLEMIANDVKKAIDTYQPHAVSIEKVFFGRNVSAEVATAHARGVALLACADLSENVGEYTPLQIKKSLVGTGSADKHQVTYMVRQTLGLDHDPKPDHCADAFAAAICHAHFIQTDAMLANASQSDTLITKRA